MVQQADYHSVAEEGAQVEDVAERHRDEDGAVERQDEVIAVEQVWETQLGNTSLDIIETFSATKIAILLWSESRATSLLCQCRNDNNSWLIALQNYYCLVGRATGQNGGTFNALISHSYLMMIWRRLWESLRQMASDCSTERLIISRINHSCAPNVYCSWIKGDKSKVMKQVRVIREIKDSVE